MNSEGSDHLSLESNEDFKHHAGLDDTEPVLYSDTIVKINKYASHQKRVIVITVGHLLNFKRKVKGSSKLTL
jgi:hypothetical protein